MAKTYEELLEQAAIIRDETAAGKNTAERVGGTITDAVDYVKELQDTYAGIHAEAAEAKTEAAAAKLTAAEAKTSAASALSNAKSAVLTANEASGTARDAKANADAAKATAEGIAATAKAAKDVADAANIAAQDAKAAADGVAETAQDAKKTAAAAQTTADQANQSATNAFGNASNAVSTANSASGTATAAKKAADEAKAGLEEAVRNLNDEDVRLNGRIDANATEIGGVKSKAETAYNYALAAQSSAETAQRDAGTAQTAAGTAQATATAASAAADAAKQAAENEATARAEADIALQSQIDGKQDNIGSFSADEKNDFLVSLGIGKIGVISQKQNWKSDYSSYTVSDVVKGIIPQYIIDHWISLSSEEKSYDGTLYFRFNEETGYFECNDLVDITLNDAINIIQYGQTETFYKNPSIIKKVRVVFCANLDSLWSRTSYLGTGQYTERVYCQGILSVTRCFIAIFDGYDLVNCPRLRDVLYINLENNSRTFYFIQLKSLTTFLGIKMKGNLSFKDSPLLSNESILFLINHEAATSAITITLHPDAYAGAMANEDILAALETHTNVSLASAQ